MTGEKGPGVFRFLPSVSDVVFIIIFLIILNTGQRLLGDADTGYHIRAGEYIIENLKVPDHDIFSHILPPIDWTAHEWLSEVVFAFIHKISGLSGIVVIIAILISSVFVLLLKFLKYSGISILIAAFMVAFAAGTSTIHWLARPHIFSLPLTLIWYIILDTYQVKGKNYLYTLPLLMLLWVNLHGGFMIGFILLVIYIIGNILKGIFVKEERSEIYARLKILFFVFFLCLLASFLNPKGFKILLFPFELTANKFIMDNVIEFLSPNFHNQLRFEYLLLFMILIFGISLLRINIIEAIIVLLFTHMSLYSARYIPLYAIMISLIVGKRLDYLLYSLGGKGIIKRFLALSDRVTNIDVKIKYPIWSICAVILVMFLLFSGRLNYAFDEKGLPVDAVEFMKKEKLKGNMFNNDEFGDYIIYTAWPEYKVFIDGRSDMYGSERMKEYFKVTGVKIGWDEVLEKYHINWIIYNNNSALSNFLYEKDDWKLIYADKVANIFVRNTPENESLIDKYKDVKPVIVEEKGNGAK